MTRYMALLLPIIALAGCASIPKTSTDLVNTSSTTQQYCYDITPDIVEQRVHDYLTSCYGPVETIIPVGAAPVPIKADFQVIQEQLLSGKRYSVRNFVGYGFAADVTPALRDCKTVINLYGISSFWRKHFAPVDAAARGQQAQCPL